MYEDKCSDKYISFKRLQNEVGIKQTAKQDKFAIPYIDTIGSFASRNRYPKTEHTMTIEYDE